MKLLTVQELKKKLEQEKSRLSTLRTAATNITSKIDGLPRAKAQSSKTERFATLIIDAENRLAELCNNMPPRQLRLLMKSIGGCTARRAKY